MLISKIDDNTFEVTHVNSKTPPMNLSKDKVREFLLAFKHDSAQTKPFGMDKLVWAPTTREAIGIWVSAADGGLSVWFQGEQFPITMDEVDQLIEDILIVTATYPKGTRVELNREVTFGIPGDEQVVQLGENLPEGTEVTVHKATVDIAGKETYVLVSDDNRYRRAEIDWFGPVRPVLAYNCIESGRQDVARNITVMAKSEVEAQKLALQQFRDMPLTAGWYRTGRVDRETSYYDDITAMPLDVTATAEREGWAINTKLGKITHLKGGPFTSASAAYDHVVRQALAGSNIHRHALAQVLGA